MKDKTKKEIEQRLKVGLFGGSFNPVQRGHMKIAEEVLKERIVDEVWFIPCGNHAFGKKLASVENRINMLKLAIKSNKKMKIIDFEIKRKEKSYTYETLKYLKQNYPHEFYFIIGSDIVKDFGKWHALDYIKKNVEFIVAMRPGYKISGKLSFKVKNILALNENCSSTDVRNLVSSGKSISEFVTKEVEEYILKEGLYNG
ncbi:MAG TPA: nicotinate (nicotinamide) nucleotide adenylyltransferase [Candidatus Nanoarchaeia archaeon]|nr:nicotinate (nicotinamide) nucleotide adenylyltransferase [Candidatus Nanoarchaeia archaeon]